MIYFTRREQERILSLFAAALPEHGVLVLGRSETMAENLRCYYHSAFPVERIYRRTADPVDPSIV
jgi:chemotaxis methyl-accepting protein methylase